MPRVSDASSAPEHPSVATIDTLVRNIASVRTLIAAAAERSGRDASEVSLASCTLFSLGELSMGMSGDHEVAIEEGADCIRLGQTFFGARTTANDLYWLTPTKE